MARGKQQPRRSRNSEGEPSSSNSLQAQGRRRRYQAHSSVLRELRRISRHMQPALARLPFQRVVREICENWRIGMRWTASALLCLQEITEDWFVELFEDAYFLAAHAHRVTLMPRDFDTLRRLRFRYDQSIHPGYIADTRMQDILRIPPLHRRSQNAESSCSHDRDTRSQRIIISEVEPQVESQVEPQPDLEPQSNPNPNPEPEPSIPQPQPQPGPTSPAPDAQTSPQPESTSPVPNPQPSPQTQPLPQPQPETFPAQICSDEREIEEIFAWNRVSITDMLSGPGIHRAVFPLHNDRKVIVFDRTDLNVLLTPEDLEVTDTIVNAMQW